MTVLICGGGFSSFWYCLGCHKQLGKGRIDGTSSGALVATLIVCMDKIDLIEILKASLKSNKFTAIDSYVYAMLDSLLPIDAHHRANKRLGIVLCNLNLKTDVITHWETREKLIHCAVASTHIPFVTSWSLIHPVYKCIDGALIIDKTKYKTLLASPSYSNLQQFRVISVRRAIELFNEQKSYKK